MKSATLGILMAFLLALPVSATAQDNVLSPLQRGVIDTVMQDDGYIVIDGKRYVWRHADVRISYRDEALPASYLSSGQRIEYRTHPDGSVRTIVVTAPNRSLDEAAQ